MRLPIRVAGIILKRDQVLLIHRKKGNDEYWVFPGGGLEDTDRSNEEGLLREIAEETSLNVEISKLLYTHNYTSNSGLYYLCKYLSGEPMLGDAIEKARMAKGNNDFYAPEWYPIAELANLKLYPLEIRDWLISDFKDGFINTPRVENLIVSELRKD